jgi:CBS domain-containing protein
MNVEQVMTTRVSWITPATTIPEIARCMRAENIGSLPVAENDRLVGVVTDRDIVLRAVTEGGDIDGVKARQVMSSQVLYCFADEAVADVLKNMGDNQVRRLPVLSRDKRLVGIVSLGDLSRAATAQSGSALKEISKPTPPGSATSSRRTDAAPSSTI